MAKRKRLSVPADTSIGAADQTTGPAHPAPPAPALEVPFAPADSVAASQRRAPIADIAGQAALTDALDRVSGELIAAKSEGRLVVKLPLEAIELNHIMRDRAHADPAEMEVLKASLKVRGQQTPIEVVDLSAGRYGLISGWRRVKALRELAEDQGASDGHAAHVLAFIRSPESASDAYTAMVEENEIRVGLSYFERASIVDRVVKAGVFPDTATALTTLFTSASRAKRSKIKSFLPLLETIAPLCQHPHALTERLGLALAARLGTDPTFLPRLKDRLRKAAPMDAPQEMALLDKALATAAPSAQPSDSKRPSAKRSRPAEPSAPGQLVSIRHSQDRITIEGPGVSKALADEIKRVVENWSE